MGYRVERNKINNKRIIIDDKDRPISGYWKDFCDINFILQKSNYYVAMNDENKYALFHKDYKKPITFWWDFIYNFGLINGESNYCLIKKDNRKAIILVDDYKVCFVSKWWGFIYSAGLIKGENDYYIVSQDSDYHANFTKEILFHKDDSDNPISDKFDKIQFINSDKFYKVYLDDIIGYCSFKDKKILLNINNDDSVISLLNKIK